MKSQKIQFLQYLLLMLLFVSTVILLMFVWLRVLRFPWGWLNEAVLGIEIVAAILVIITEYQGKDVQGAAGWMSFAFVMLSGMLGFVLLLLRCVVWGAMKWIL